MGEEADPEWVIQTQQTLGELIKRPKLTGALLQKPPFRFLHDIVSEVTKVTGFASGLYQEDELQSAKIKVCARVAPTLALRSRAQCCSVAPSSAPVRNTMTPSPNAQDKDAKTAYLGKIIKCVELSLGISMPLKVGKVVAGLEAENTNMFLQYLHQAATTVPDSSVAVSQVLAEMPSAMSAADAAPEARAPPPPPPASKPEPSSYTEPAQTEMAAPEQSLQQMSSGPVKPRDEPDLAAADDGASSKRVRPKSARRPPPKITSNEVKVDKRLGGAQEAAPSVASGIIVEGAHEEATSRSPIPCCPDRLLIAS